MRTYKLSNYQETVVVEVETDAITSGQDNMTIHDINVVAGSFDKFVESGFKWAVPNVITKIDLATFATQTNLNLSIINPANEGTKYDILTALEFAFVTEAPDDGTEGEAYDLALVVENESGDVVYELVDGALPGGLTLSSAGVISGTVDADSADDYVFTVKATDYFGQVITKEFTITVLVAT